MSGNLEITIAYERGKCSVCKEITQVRLIMDKEKVCKICKKCVGELGEKPASEILSEHGKKRNTDK